MTSVGIPHSVAAALPTLSVFDITNEVSRDVHHRARRSRDRLRHRGGADLARAGQRA